MSAPRLLNIGSVVVDHVYRIAALPAPGAEVTASEYLVSPGGSFNLMVAALRAGLPVAFGGAHGTGPNGELLRAAMEKEGVDILSPPTPGIDSGVSTVLVTGDGERSFISWPGAEARPYAFRLKAQPQDWLFASGYTLSYPASGESVAAKAERLARTNPLVFDPTPVVLEIPSAILARVLEATRWLSCNADEAAFITGGSEFPAKALLERYCPNAAGVVIRAGEAGCLVRLRDGRERALPGFSVDVVDTNGAGDTHIGAFTASLAKGVDPFRAALYANAAAAIAVTRRGGPTAPTHTETIEFLGRHQHPWEDPA